MTPEADRILGLLAGQMMTDMAPLLPADYAKGAVALTALVMALAAQEYDRAAEIRTTENAEMRALFKTLAPLIEDAHLKAELEDAAARTDASLKISRLNESNYALRRLMIALHAHVETLTGDAARDAEAQIWRLLKTFAGRRLLHLPQG